MVDVTIVGHLGSAVYLAAIAIGGSVFNMLYWLFGFLRMGSSGLTAQACGAGDSRRCSVVLYRALAVALVAGVLVIAASGPLTCAVLAFMDAGGDTGRLAGEYVAVCVYGAPAVLATYVMSGWFLGMQNSRAQMWISVSVNLFNIAASLVLVYGLGGGIRGVAAGTLSAQWVGVAVGLWICRRHYRLEHVTLGEILDWRELRRFFSINLDIFLRTVCLVAVTMWFTRAGARQSTVMLDVNALLMQLFMLFSYFMDGFAYAGEALCGRMAGAGDRRGLARSVRSLITCGMVLAVVFTLVYVAVGDRIIGLMSGEPEVVAAASEYLGWAVSVPVAGFLAFTWDGVFIGTTRTRLMLVSMGCASAVFFIVYVLCFPALGNHGLWLAFVVYLLVRGAVQSVLGRRMICYRL